MNIYYFICYSLLLVGYNRVYIYEVYVWLLLLWGCRGVYTSWVSDYALNGTEVG